MFEECAYFFFFRVFVRSVCVFGTCEGGVCDDDIFFLACKCNVCVKSV